MKIKAISTKELLEELRQREGVWVEAAGPYEEKEVVVNGPAVVLIVTD